MATLRMRVTTATMPHTPEFFAVVKAVERFYYALLFSTSAEYSGRPEPWRSWVDQGFSVAIRQAPPETRKTDVLTTSVHSDGKIIELTAESVNEDLLSQVGDLLAAVGAALPASSDGAAGGRQPAEMGGSNDLRERLVDPVASALESAGVDERTSDRIMEMLSAAIRALKYRHIVSIEEEFIAGGDPEVSVAAS